MHIDEETPFKNVVELSICRIDRYLTQQQLVKPKQKELQKQCIAVDNLIESCFPPDHNQSTDIEIWVDQFGRNNQTEIQDDNDLLKVSFWFRITVLSVLCFKKAEKLHQKMIEICYSSDENVDDKEPRKCLGLQKKQALENEQQERKWIKN